MRFFPCAVAVLWPVVKMVSSSTTHWSRYGVNLGSNGAANYTRLFDEHDLGGVLIRTGIWVVVVNGIPSKVPPPPVRSKVKSPASAR